MINLRDLTDKDDNLLVSYLNNENVVKFLSSRIPQPYTVDDAHWWIKTGSKAEATVKAIEYKGTFCGVIGIYHQQFEYAHSAEIGYWLAEPFWQKGIASAAVNMFSEYLFDSTELIRLVAPVFSDNVASMKVLQKCGFVLEGVAEKALYKHGRYYDEHRFAKVRDSEAQE